MDLFSHTETIFLVFYDFKFIYYAFIQNILFSTILQKNVSYHVISL